MYHLAASEFDYKGNTYKHIFCLLLCFLQNVPQVDAEGFCIRPEVNENDILCPDAALARRLGPDS